MTEESNQEMNTEERVLRLSADAPAATPPITDADSSERTSRRPRSLPRSYSTMHVSDEERLWAAIAHASVWITFVTGFATAGFGVPLSIFLPLVIYFMYRKKSDYVAFHALQAFVIQLVGTVGALTLLVVGGIVWFIGLVVALILVLVLVGFVVAPLWVLLGLAGFVAVCLMPFAMLLFGTIAAVQTYNGHDYRYPYIARWVDSQLAAGLLNLF